MRFERNELMEFLMLVPELIYIGIYIGDFVSFLHLREEDLFINSKRLLRLSIINRYLSFDFMKIIHYFTFPFNCKIRGKGVEIIFQHQRAHFDPPPPNPLPLENIQPLDYKNQQASDDSLEETIYHRLKRTFTPRPQTPATSFAPLSATLHPHSLVPSFLPSFRTVFQRQHRNEASSRKQTPLSFFFFLARR